MDTLSTLTPEAKQFYERNLLFRARQAQIFYDLASLTNMPKNGGNQVSWRRFNALSLATSALTEGVTPTASALNMTEVTGTVNQYGNYVSISDAVNLMAIDDVMMEATDVLGQNGGESIDAVIRNVIQAGTSVIYATGSARSSVGTANVLTLSLLRRAIATLDANNTRRFGGPDQNSKIGNGRFKLLIHPWQVQDLLNDSEIRNALQYGGNNEIQWDGQVGKIYNVDIMQSTLVPVFAGQGSGGANVYGSLLIGANAFGAVNVAGKGKYELIVKQLGSAGADDPLNQRGSIGWTGWQLPVILNNNFMVRVETGATNG